MQMILSAICLISDILCEIYKMATSVLRSLSKTLNNLSASFAESEEVGSSKMRTLGFLAIARAMAINWRSATPSAETGAFTSRFKSIVSAIFIASSRRFRSAIKNPDLFSVNLSSIKLDATFKSGTTPSLID